MVQQLGSITSLLGSIKGFTPTSSLGLANAAHPVKSAETSPSQASKFTTEKVKAPHAVSKLQAVTNVLKELNLEGVNQGSQDLDRGIKDLHLEQYKNTNLKNKDFTIVQLDVTPGRPDLNFEKMKEAIIQAAENGNEVVVFSEMVLPGYMIGDMWFQEAFLADLAEYHEEIRELTRQYGLTVIFGSADYDPTKKNRSGKVRCYNATFVASHGEWVSNGALVGKTYKTLLPTYGKFDDQRYFYSLEELAKELGVTIEDLLRPFEITLRDGRKIKIGISICEDMWQADYLIKPIDILVKNGSDIILNLSCSPWTLGKNKKRDEVVRAAMAEHGIPFVYTNNIGQQNIGKTMYAFDGVSTVYNSRSQLIQSAAFFQEDTIAFNYDDVFQEAMKTLDPYDDNNQKAILTALIYTMRKFYGDKRNILIGVSGGIDSAFMLALATLALGKDRIWAVTMPSNYNSNATKNDAFEIAKHFGVKFAISPIQDIHELHIQAIEGTQFVQLHPDSEIEYHDIPVRPLRNGIWNTIKATIHDLFNKPKKFIKGLPVIQLAMSGVNKENDQARIRGSTLQSGLSATPQMKALYTNNGNFMEMTIGWCTIYGDLNGSVAWIGDTPKEKVYDMSRFINELAGTDLIPQSIIDRLPTAELSEEQSLEKGVGDPIKAGYHDWMFALWNRYDQRPVDFLEMYLKDEWPQNRRMLPENINPNEISFREYVKRHYPTKEEFIDNLEDFWTRKHRNYFKRIVAPVIMAIYGYAFGFDHREAQLSVYFTRKFARLKKEILETK